MMKPLYEFQEPVFRENILFIVSAVLLKDRADKIVIFVERARVAEQGSREPVPEVTLELMVR